MSRRPSKSSEHRAASGATVWTGAAGGVWMIGMWMFAAAARAEPPSVPAEPPSVQAEPPAVQAASAQEYARGEALFSGTIDLHGRIYTHVADMPTPVVRCSNCHAVADGPDVPRSLAPRLTHNLLLLPRARRGGPPSNYNRDGFCTLLRRGVDPAFVMISVEMPRYAIDDVNCAALWRYLTGTRHGYSSS